jgi:hypothetical protein
MRRSHFAPAYRRVGYQDNIAEGVSAAVVEVPGKTQPVLLYRFLSTLFGQFLQPVVEKQQFGTDKIKMLDCLLAVCTFVHKKTQ